MPWAGGAVVLVAVIGAVAKIVGVIVAPGMVGNAAQRSVELVELLSATLGYAFGLLLLGLICFGSFELAKLRTAGVVSRGIVVAVSGLVIALAAPSVVQHLHPIPDFVLALVTSIVVLVGALATLRLAHTRVVGAVLALFALSGLLRPIAWGITSMSLDNPTFYGVARVLSSISLVVQALGTLLAAAWLGTRSRVRGRLLSNGAIVLAFGVTYLAASSGESTSTLQAVLHASLAQTIGLPLPYGLTSIAAFLVPATTLLALVAVVQRTHPPVVLASLALALLSQGALDVPLQALAIAAAVQWGMLAMDNRTMWSTLLRSRETKDVRAT